VWKGKFITNQKTAALWGTNPTLQGKLRRCKKTKNQDSGEGIPKLGDEAQEKKLQTTRHVRAGIKTEKKKKKKRRKGGGSNTIGEEKYWVASHPDPGTLNKPVRNKNKIRQSLHNLHRRKKKKTLEVSWFHQKTTKSKGEEKNQHDFEGEEKTGTGDVRNFCSETRGVPAR